MVRNLTRPSRGTSEHYEVVYKLLPGHDVTNGQNFQQNWSSKYIHIQV